jgi:hypothetical protein
LARFSTATSGVSTIDDLVAYLDAPRLPSNSIAAMGGVLKYWDAQKGDQPRVARMATHYCSAPGEFDQLQLYSHEAHRTNHSTATSVAAERKFSDGRRACNFMQHNMSDNSFRARMALGSWQDTPLFPGTDKIAEWIAATMRTPA